MTGPATAWAQARLIAHTASVPLPPQRRTLNRCGGTVLAQPLVALSALPPHDVSAMDGYAVCGPGPWRVVGELPAGARWDAPLAAGTAVATATGAALPVETTAVLPVEQAQVQHDVVTGVVTQHQHVRRAGEECDVGDVLLQVGWPVTAAVLGLAAASGHDMLEVRPRPRVAALVTGDELLAEGLPRDGQVRDALGPQLPLLVAAQGGDLVELMHLRDDFALLQSQMHAADADVVVTTGASSAGPADHLRPVLAALGARLLVDGVACRPGHPQTLALLPDGRAVVGLPGNPLAALVAAVTLLGPLLAGLGGRPLQRAEAVLAEGVRAAAGSTRLIPVSLERGQATPVQHTGSGMLRGAALADALAVVPPGRDPARGATVEVLPLP